MEKLKSILPYVPLILFVGAIVYYNWGAFLRWREGPESPRNAIHYYETDDSVYKVRYIIDSAWEREYEPAEDPR